MAPIAQAEEPVASERPYVHYRMPARPQIEQRLREAGRIGRDATQAEISEAVRDWQAQFAKASPSWARPEDREAVLANEEALLSGESGVQPMAPTEITAAVLAIPVEFSATETLGYWEPNATYSACTWVTETFEGPMHGNIPYPGGSPTETIDNNTTYYPSTEPENYEELIFGTEGITEPLRPGDPNVNDGLGLDISGLTVQTYYDAQSDSSVTVTGTVVPWVAVTHTEAYYGIDLCVPGFEPPSTADGQIEQPAELVVDAIEALKAEGGPYDTYEFWQQYDNDGDGWVDTLWIIHAGGGQEAGGGAEGEHSIWSHSSNLTYYGYEEGYVVHDNGTGDPADDLRVGPYTFQPENGDLGVFSEEFGHNFFHFPDLYTTDSSNSVGWWSHMAAGSWGGELGGTQPVNMPLWFRMVADCNGTACGWADPVKVLSYTTPVETVFIGQAGEPAGDSVQPGDWDIVPLDGADDLTIYEGVRIDLPDQVEVIENMAGTGAGMYSTSGDMMDNTLDREVDLSEATGTISLTLDAYWDIETNWDYGYVEVSTDGVNFVSLDDLDGILTETNPNGNNLGHGLTGSGADTLAFDLSSYAGDEITLRFRYRTDAAVSNPGWWIDNVAIDGVLVEGFEGGVGDWSVDGWRETPYTETYEHYYLVEWRNANGFDESLLYPYNTNYSDEDEWRVDRVPANVPAAVVMYRNTRYDFSYALDPQIFDAPSLGSKYGLLVVDANYEPVMRPSGEFFSGRLQSVDGALALQDQPDYTLEVWDGVEKTLVMTETLQGTSGVQRFDDALGYYPGLFLDDMFTLWFWDWDSSVVIPSVDNQFYSTRVTDMAGEPLEWVYGMDLGGGHYLGTGNPGDAGVQYGLHIELVDKAADGSWGMLRIYNAAMDYALFCDPDVVWPGRRLELCLSMHNRGSVDTDVDYVLPLPQNVTLLDGLPSDSITVAPGETVSRCVSVRIDDWPPRAAGDEDVPLKMKGQTFTAHFYDGTEEWERMVMVPFIEPWLSYLPSLFDLSAQQFE